MMRTLVCIILTAIVMIACGEKRGTPKPRAYPRVEYPERSYKPFQQPDCPFTFEYPAYAEIKAKDQPCWFDLFMPQFNARLHCSYLPVKDKEAYADLVHDVFTIAKKINERANYMQETRIHNDQGAGGLQLNWTGPAASPVHFFLTDTTQHFFTAALYYDSKVQPDSLAPITEFILKDVDQMIHSFMWKK